MGHFDNRLAFGQIGEGYIAQWLIHARGFHVLPVYEKEIETGKGPTLFTDAGPIVAPDLLVFKPKIHAAKTKEHNRVLWVEAKTKSAFTWHRISRTWTTGIDQRHYNAYLQVNEMSLWPVWLLFLHLDGTAKDTPDGMLSPQGLFGGSLTYLSEHIHHTSDKWANGMVYWAYTTLYRIATLDEVMETSQETDL